ncbi:hypothetical protein WAI453_013167 [Rhynchosporium graminicola]
MDEKKLPSDPKFGKHVRVAGKNAGSDFGIKEKNDDIWAVENKICKVFFGAGGSCYSSGCGSAAGAGSGPTTAGGPDR